MSVLVAVMDGEWMEAAQGDDGRRAPWLLGQRHPRQWLYAAAGCVLALGAPAGLLAVRWLQDPAGGGMMDVIAADLPAFAYVAGSTLVVFAAFGLVLGRQADEAAALTLAERIRSLAEDMALPGGLRARVSLGVACAALGEGWTPPGILERADRALYEAKRTGRNRVVLDKEDSCT